MRSGWTQQMRESLSTGLAGAPISVLQMEKYGDEKRV